MAAIIVRFEVDFALLLQAVMHERDFKVTTTCPFPCIIYSLCRSTSVPIWHINQLNTPQGNVDIVLIRDEAKQLAPYRGPRPELPSLREILADTVAHALTTTQVAFETTDTTSVESIPGSSIAPSCSCSAPCLALVPCARVQKLEAQMAIFLHHIKP